MKNIPVRCSLHRPMLTSFPPASGDIRQFLYYQQLTAGMRGLWIDAISQKEAGNLIIAHCQRDVQNSNSAADNIAAVSLPTQHYIPHCLGRTDLQHDWFSITLMMQMALSQSDVQCAMINHDGSLMLNSVSAGAFTDD